MYSRPDPLLVITPLRALETLAHGQALRRFVLRHDDCPASVASMMQLLEGSRE
jgi:hypothetical protein